MCSDTRKWCDGSPIAYSTVVAILKSVWMFCMGCHHMFDLPKPKMPVVINIYQGVVCVIYTARITSKTHLRKVSTDSVFSIEN